jgi:2-hydroxy-3-oxopropionate reductase
MGQAVAERLCHLGVSVVATGSGPDRQKYVNHPSIATRPNPAAVISELAAGGEEMTVLVCVPAGERVTKVVFGPEGLLDGLPRAAQLLMIDLSVAAVPTVAAEMAAALGARGHRYVDAPTAGGPAGASSGTLSIMAGGEPEDIDAAMPWLNLLGKVSRCGPPGTGQVVGVCHQALVASGIMAVAEILALAEHSGVDPEVARTALIEGYQSSGATGPHGLESLARDVGIAQRLAARAGLPSPMVDATNAVVRRLTGLDIEPVAMRAAN